MSDKQYLKMADVFSDEVKCDSDYLLNNELGEIANFSGYKRECRYAAHAINSHDELVRQRDELLSVIADHDRLVRELDVLLNGKDGSAKQASLCDLVAQARKKASLLGLGGGLLIELDRQNVLLDCTKEVIRYCREELQDDDAAIFLRLWLGAEWEVLHEEFPDADDIIYAADPLWSGWNAKGGAA